MKWTADEDLTKYGINMVPEEKIIPLGDQSKKYQIYSIPLKLLKYNRNNGRIFMEVSKLQRENDIDLTKLMDENIEQYNNEIEKLIWESSIEKNNDTLEDIEKYTQLESGVVLDDGTVVDGNRRFTCLRKLASKYPNDERYNSFKAAIIIRDNISVTDKELKKYELKVQFGRDEKVDYKSINFAMTIFYNVKSGNYPIIEIAEDVKKTPSDITKIIQTCELIEEMLIYINQKNELPIAEELNLYWPLEPLAAYLNGAKGSKLTKIEKDIKKKLFFDFLLTLDVALPTQELRDNLIKKIYSDDILFDELRTEYESAWGEIVQKELIDSKPSPEELVSKVKEFRKTEAAIEIQQAYKKVVNKKNMQTHADAPIKLCGEINDRLKEINLIPFLNATSSLADEKLDRIREQLSLAQTTITSLIGSIDNKKKD